MLRIHVRIPQLLALVAAIGALASSAAAQSGKHPRLVSAQSARCATCHAKLVEDKKVVHPATEDCTNCHEVEVGEGGTQIRLAEAEPTLCVNCHSEREGLEELPTPHPAAVDGCTTCHDPHAGDFPRMLRARQAEVCMECHDLDSLAAPHSNLVTAGTTCTTCHDPHGTKTPKLLAGSHLHPPFEDKTCEACHRPNFGERIRLMARGQRLCLACHEDPAEIAERKSRHGALDDDERGRAACLNCHSPHLSPRPRMLVADRPELCGNCHPGIVTAALAATGHPAASDDCLNCHLPHASGQPKLLKAYGSELCGECHDTGDEDLSKKHLGANLAHLSCLTCHSPHGAGQPHLLSANVHPPVLDDCANCHQGAYNQLEENGDSPLCLNCHSEIGELAESAPVHHDAMDAGSCVICHSPHATPRPKLVRAAADGCGSCHDDKIAGEGEVQHGVIDLIGCQACHEPHGGTKPRMLRAEGAELCLSCHGQEVQKAASGGPATVLGRFEMSSEDLRKIRVVALTPDGARNHPVEGHRTIGAPTDEELVRVESTFRGELSCLVCHDPHKGRARQLLAWRAVSPTEACMHCHPK